MEKLKVLNSEVHETKKERECVLCGNKIKIGERYATKGNKKGIYGVCKHCFIIINPDKYKDAYDILMEYWDCLPDEEKPLIDEKLKKLGL